MADAEILLLWAAWLFPFALYTRAPRPASVTISGPTYAGLFLECAGIVLAGWIGHAGPPGAARIAASLIFGLPAVALSWASTRALGRHLRIRAGLYPDHELVRTGPYAIVRHPIYAALLGMLLTTMALRTSLLWMPLPLLVFISGTEIRVRTEDRLLESHFGDEFRRYKSTVPAYIPFIR